MTVSTWRAAAAASASAVLMIACGAPVLPVVFGVGGACGFLWWRARGSR
jgi:hypothetical protein